MSLQNSVLKTLSHGRQFTAGQMAGLFGTTETSVAAGISELRSQGYSIYSNTAKNGKTACRLGTPSRRMIAAAYAAVGSSVFN